jgi:hypothetical protein
MGTWLKNSPTTNNKIKEIPAIIQDNFDAIEDAYELEHYSPASANVVPGAHRLGVIGAIGQGTTVELTGSSPLSGALAYDTTRGILRRYNGASWNDIGTSYHSRVRAYLSSSVPITASTGGVGGRDIVYDTEDYDTLGEYDNTTGIFTAKASGYYVVIAQASLVASGTQLDTAVVSATGRLGTYTWLPSGSSLNYQNIDEYPTPIDTDFNTAQTCGATDTFSGSLPPLPDDTGLTYVTVAFRGRRRGCVCNSTCYGGYSACSCNNSCYGYTACSCNAQCYGYGACSCNNSCYGQGCYCDYACYGQGCTCNYTCYGDVACTCNATCYGYTACSCNAACYGYGACSCNAACYGYGACSCDNTCYVYSKGVCSCHSTCYGYSACSCNNTCYGGYSACSCNNSAYGQSCICNNECYGYGACTCNAACNGQTCTCNGSSYGATGCSCYNTCYGYGACSCNNQTYGAVGCSCNNTCYAYVACSCNNTCYGEDVTRPAAVLRKGNINYTGATILLTTAFADYMMQWGNDPSTGNLWTSAALSAIQGFGYTIAEGTTGCSADISQCYLKADWFPPRPTIRLYLLKGNTDQYQYSFFPIKEPGTASWLSSYQAANIFSIMFLLPGDYIKIHCIKSIDDDVIYGGSAYSFIAIHRLPVDCL